MNLSKTLTLIVLVGSILTACAGDQSEGLKTYEARDPKTGQVSSRMPIPASWEVLEGDKQYLFSGPENIRVTKSQSAYFAFAQDPSMLQVMQQTGQQVRNPLSIEQIVEEFLKPAAREYGSELVGIEPLPMVAESMFRFVTRLYSDMPTNWKTRSWGVEWLSGDKSTRVLSIVTVNIAYSQPSSYWTLMVQGLEAPASAYQKNKQLLLSSLAQYQVDENWLAAKNQADAQRSALSNQQHQGRMAQIRSAGQAALRNGQIYSDIADSSHSSYMRRQQISDAGQARTINSINEEQVLVNPNGGQQYQVQSYTNQHWLNNDGTYIGTDDANFDPRTDPSYYDGEWVELEEQPYDNRW